jgi:putative AbiEii toxin of type IV toxin-antitoxin system
MTPMLTKIRLQNFRGFADHELPILPLTLIVGRNNAGKSTIIEALRFIALATARYQTVPYNDPPEDLKIPDNFRGISPSLRDIDFDRINLFYRYGRPPAIIQAEFGDSGSVAVYLYGADQVFIVTINSNGQIIQSIPQAKSLTLPRINILPQVSPVANTEEILNENYVRRSVSSSRSSTHFRNQLKIFQESFSSFRRLCEDNWPKLQIRELLSERGEHRNEVELHVRDEDFVGEIRWMGHGLQIWLQTMWFLARTDPEDVVVLDEPDVYLHADLQRKLIRILKTEDRQAIIATHSIEMMSEVEPSSILVTDRRRRKSEFTTSLPGVQAIIDQIGGVHNIHLARLWSSKKVIFVEGDDLTILKIFQDKLFPASNEPLDALPNFPIGGWGGWNYVVGSSMLLKQGGSEGLAKYCILDRDYHTANEIHERYKSATEHRINLHVWGKKEIENYLLLPATITRHINNMKKKGKGVNKEDVEGALDEICEGLRDETHDLISEEYIRRNRPKNAAAEGNKHARGELRTRWTSLSGKLAVVSGKSVLSQISSWAQSNHGVSLNAYILAKSTSCDELDSELISIMTALETGSAFPGRTI